MNEGIKERISALVDGELSEFEARRVLEEIEAKPELRDYWNKLQITKSGLKERSLGYLDRDISKRVAAELGEHTYEPGNSKTTSGFNLSMVAAALRALFLYCLLEFLILLKTLCRLKNYSLPRLLRKSSKPLLVLRQWKY
ncbi:MAG: hypothetical protein Ct9H300mP20_06730 [Gammaproteobacteria bacterium]|nr:MAG: hypothetical protein Ct9H300mP20_06730 [Gammaproteobacteria bacterium]